MSVNALASHLRGAPTKSLSRNRSRLSRMVFAEPADKLEECADFSFVDLGDSARVVLMLAPKGRGPFSEQAREVLSRLEAVLRSQPRPMAITSQTVFLRDAEAQRECERLFAAHYGEDLPVTNFVLQAPCCGAALTMEVWAIGGESVRVEHYGPNALSVSYDSVRWIYCAGLKAPDESKPVFDQTAATLEQMRSRLFQAGSRFEHVVRTWFYLGGITESERRTQRYQELNRARTDFYRDIHFRAYLLPGAKSPQRIYPASTGIGMSGRGLVVNCLSLETNRSDVFLFPLENPQQTPAYDYARGYSRKSPKFSRAMALVLGDYLTTWISGTASILDSETCHAGDIEKQTEQTIDNIERLIAPENFAAHGFPSAGAQLHDLAKIRVYLKRAEDFAACKAICQRRFGPVPAIYAVADVCRPDLLVEIEGVSFSRGL